MEKEIDVQQELVRVLDFYKEQIQSGKCTMNAMLSMYRLLMENMEVEGTVKDFAMFYGVSENNVRHVISRYMVKKPTRRVFYKFHEFLKIVPRKWLSNRD